MKSLLTDESLMRSENLRLLDPFDPVKFDVNNFEFLGDIDSRIAYRDSPVRLCNPNTGHHVLYPQIFS